MSEFCYGFVRELGENGRVRVEFPDRDGVQSFWLGVLVQKTHRDKHCWLPDPGEHVACLLDANAEDGLVLGAIYSARDPAPERTPDAWLQSWADGGFIRYDRTAGELVISAPVKIRLESQCILANHSPVCRIGDVDDKGDVMVTGACGQ